MLEEYVHGKGRIGTKKTTFFFPLIWKSQNVKVTFLF